MTAVRSVLAAQFSWTKVSLSACFYLSRANQVSNPSSPRESLSAARSCPWIDQVMGLPSHFLASSTGPSSVTIQTGTCRDRLCSACCTSCCLASSGDLEAILPWAHIPQFRALFPLFVLSAFCLRRCDPYGRRLPRLWPTVSSWLRTLLIFCFPPSKRELELELLADLELLRKSLCCYCLLL